MDDNLCEKWGKLRLTEDEEVVIGDNTDEDNSSGIKDRISLSLLGKLLTVKPFNVEAMKRTLLSIWSLKNSVVIRMVETNLFVLQFFCEKDKNRVLDGCPWSFDGKILLLKELKEEEQPSEVKFSNSPFWVRLMDVPFGKRNASFASIIGEKLGGFIKFDDSDPVGWEMFMRVKINLDIGKPLPRGIKVRVGQDSTKWVGFKYERLGDFCYFCGRLGHTDRDCPHITGTEDGPEMVYQYGPFMVASPIRRTRKSFSVSEKERIWMESLSKKKEERWVSFLDKEVGRTGTSSAAKKITFDPLDSERTPDQGLVESGIADKSLVRSDKGIQSFRDKGEEQNKLEEIQNSSARAEKMEITTKTEGLNKKTKCGNWKRIIRKDNISSQDGMQIADEMQSVGQGNLGKRPHVEIVEEPKGPDIRERVNKARRTLELEKEGMICEVAGVGNDQPREKQ